MNLNEFTTNELETLAEMLQSSIDTRRKLRDTHRLDGFKNRYQKEIDTYELMRVKVNNALGKFNLNS
jgi:hypothetical protein